METERWEETGKPRWNQKCVLVSRSDRGATWSDVSRAPRSHVIQEHVILCHSCLGLSRPRRHVSSTVTVTSRYGRPNWRLIDGNTEMDGPTKPTQLWPGSAGLEPASWPRLSRSMKEASSCIMKTDILFDSIIVLTWLNLLKKKRCILSHWETTC